MKRKKVGPGKIHDSFPFEHAVKTRLQSQEGSPRVGLAALVRRIYATEGGVRAFFPGYVPCLLRAAPANAVCFLAVEWTLAACGFTEGH